MSAAISLQEGTPLVKGVPTTRIQVLIELVKVMAKINVIESIMMFSRAARVLSDPKNTNAKGSFHFLIHLNTINKEMNVSAYKENDIEKAQKAYEEAERKKVDGVNVVLASASSYAALKKAYPNYFLDTRKFLQMLHETLAFLSKDLPEIIKK
jgi:UDP-N-acetyl-D-mannosaminuronic acid transferase (WecB/TagA/CpsF family)